MKLVATALLLAQPLALSLAEVSVTVRNDTVTVWDANFSWPCAGVFFVRSELTGSQLRITECDTMPLTTCMCPFTVGTTFTGLAPGTYTALVSRRHEGNIIYTEFAGSVGFTISGASPGPVQVSVYQRGCSQSVSSKDFLPKSVRLLPVFPNPHNPSATVRYELPYRGLVRLDVFSMLGQHMMTLVEGEREAGTHEVSFEGHYASGLYVCRLQFGSRTLSQVMIRMR